MVMIISCKSFATSYLGSNDHSAPAVSGTRPLCKWRHTCNVSCPFDPGVQMLATVLTCKMGLWECLPGQLLSTWQSHSLKTTKQIWLCCSKVVYNAWNLEQGTKTGVDWCRQKGWRSLWGSPSHAHTWLHCGLTCCLLGKTLPIISEMDRDLSGSVQPNWLARRFRSQLLMSPGHVTPHYGDGSDEDNDVIRCSRGLEALPGAASLMWKLNPPTAKLHPELQRSATVHGFGSSCVVCWICHVCNSFVMEGWCWCLWNCRATIKSLLEVWLSWQWHYKHWLWWWLFWNLCHSGYGLDNAVWFIVHAE